MRKGFSLVEVMIVVAIIGILATLAYPKMERYLMSSKQAEVKTNLMAIYNAQKIYYATNQSYANDFDVLGVEVNQEVTNEDGDVIGSTQTGSRYVYTLAAADGGFTVTGTGNLDEDATEDIWTIDEDKALSNTTNDILN